VNEMKRIFPLLAAGAMVASSCIAPARAVPPVAQPSPGYEARLQESRKAAPTTVTPVQPSKKKRKAPPQ
jgi:hypothetical protein